MYLIFFLVVASSTAFILIILLMDGLEARLIYCWTICCNLARRFMVVKAATVLSRDEVIGRGMELNFGDGERKGGFWDKFGIWRFKDL